MKTYSIKFSALGLKKEFQVKAENAAVAMARFENWAEGLEGFVEFFSIEEMAI